MLTINNTLEGYLKDVEILGNTIQDASNLADIRSVGDKVEGQELYEIPVISRGKNLINPKEFSSVDSYGYCTIDIKVKSSTEYRFTHMDNVTNGSIGDILQLNAKNEVISDYQGVWHGSFLTTSANTVKIRLKTHKDRINKVKMCEGKELCYEPYVEDKLTILSPVQLEKVGDVADRIICKDGVWGVEKNVVTEFVLGDSWIQLTFDDVIMFGTSSNYKMSKGFGISNYFIYEGSDTNTEHFKYDIKNNKIYTYIKKSKLSTEDGVGFLKWSRENGYYHKFATTQPTFIPLPHDQQVKLRTFASKTNISFLTEIEGTIKAQVPKSLGATVNTHTEQISNLNKELDRVKKLEESTVSTVTTESDFTTVEATSGGYFEDVKLEGKTLLNLWDINNMNLQNSGAFDTVDNATRKNGDWIEVKTSGASWITPACKLVSVIKPSTLYTVIFEIKDSTYSNDKKVSSNIQFHDTNVNKPESCFDTQKDIYLVNGVNIFTLKSRADVDGVRYSLRTQFQPSFVGEGSCKFRVTLLEGDHTQNPPSYFEGLKSVGQSASEDGVDEIVVSSVKGDGNLVEFDSVFTSGVGSWDDANLSGDVSHSVSVNSNPCKVTITNNSQYHFLAFKTTIKKGVSYSYKFDSTSHLGNDVSLFKDLSSTRGQLVGSNFSGTFIANDDYSYIAIPINKEVSTYSVSDFILTKGTQITEYTPHQSDKKRLLYYNTETQSWEKPILREWDSIEKHADGKYYYHQRSGEVVLNGSEDWKYTSSQSGENTLFFHITIDTAKKHSSIICDTMKVSPTDLWLPSVDFESVFITDNYFLQCRINKSKLSTQDVAGFKQWLQANNVTVVYQLAEEKVYECTNIDLITYANETNYIVECGAIAPKSILKVHNNISNVVKILQEKVSLLENKFIEGLKKVLAGDMYSLAELLYPEDFVEENPENEIMLLPFE